MQEALLLWFKTCRLANQLIALRESAILHAYQDKFAKKSDHFASVFIGTDLIPVRLFTDGSFKVDFKERSTKCCELVTKYSALELETWIELSYQYTSGCEPKTELNSKSWYFTILWYPCCGEMGKSGLVLVRAELLILLSGCREGLGLLMSLSNKK